MTDERQTEIDALRKLVAKYSTEAAQWKAKAQSLEGVISSVLRLIEQSRQAGDTRPAVGDVDPSDYERPQK